MRKLFSTIIKFTKKVVSYIFYYTGVTGYILKKKLSNKTVILTYHRVLPVNLRDKRFSHQAILVDPANFDMHLSVICEYFKVIDTRVLFNGNKECEPRCLITFDDGWCDNYEYAYPILMKYNCPAIVFVPLDYISTNKTFWQEKLGYLMWHASKLDSDKTRALLNKYGIDEICKSEGSKKQSAIINYVRSLKARTYKQLEEIKQEFLEIVDYGDGSYVDKHMTWDQIRELDKNGIEIGSHACSHKILTELAREEVIAELEKSKTSIENNLQAVVKSIAYPNGDYNDVIGDVARSEGYMYGFGTEFGNVDENSNRYNLKRININDTVADSKPIFLATLIGIF
ncbi:MAG: polysaccharide deacetylase family protein [Candidatus Thiodiazotropha endolucinida]|nr:polysaccharide deacetylase family protein [Candidatus Thiodiazotropha taylori]MCW4297059.1 polysaccharide deacetylase family protein [Candidatus Thiodiazotropha endolucinida]